MAEPKALELLQARVELLSQHAAQMQAKADKCTGRRAGLSLEEV